MMKNSYFSLNLLNIFVGLSHGSMLLKPFSKEFKKFNYNFFGIEKDLKGINIKPECILVSQKIGNTLLFEWTQAPFNSKEEQLDRYLSTTPEKLYEAYIPIEASKSFDLFYVIDPKWVDQYENDKLDNGQISLFSFDNEKLLLVPIANRLSSEEVKSFFAEQMKFDRVPKIISIDFEHPNDDDLRRKIIAIFVKFLLRSDTKNIIASEIAQEIFHQKYWNKLGKDKKAFLINKTVDTMSGIIKHKALMQVMEEKARKGSDKVWIIKQVDQSEKIKVAKKIQEILKTIKTDSRYQKDFQFDHFITV